MTAAVAVQRGLVRALHRRWSPMRPHAIQAAYYESAHRFNVTPGRPPIGEDGDREAPPRPRALRGSKYDRPRYFAGAPTWDQAKRIFWDDLKRMVPRDAMRGAARPKPWSDGELVIPLWHGGEIYVLGMDKSPRGSKARRTTAASSTSTRT
jgi:hypothetical protein